MTIKPLPNLAFILLLGGILIHPIEAQQHRATRLGHPTTRFAKPLKTVDDLRALFRSEALRADVLSILDQAGWKGDVEDLRRAAASVEVVTWRIPVGDVLPYMSSRKDGKPIVLWDVLWAGEQPIDALAFDFSSKGVRYRCITPKACSNFWVEELGPEPPALRLVKTAPAELRLCDRGEVSLVAVNTGRVPLTGVRIRDELPSGVQAVDVPQDLTFEVGDLAPGQSKGVKYVFTVAAPDRYASRAEVTAKEGARAEARSVTQGRQAVLALGCRAPGQVFAGRPATVTLTVTNVGDASDDHVQVVLPLPEGTTVSEVSDGASVSASEVRWILGPLVSGQGRQLTATVSSPNPSRLTLSAVARGACVEPVPSRCETIVAGVPAILLEVIDLDDPIEVGADEIYEVKVTNQGSAPATNVRLLCVVEDTQQFVSGSGPTPVKADGDAKVTIEPLATLDPKADATWRVVVKAVKVGDVRFAVELLSDQIDRPVRETEATQQY